MKEILFIGDTHFGHKRVIEMCSRPYSSVEDMEEGLINNWNRKIKKEYKIFMMGDFALANRDTVLRVGPRLNGRKTLIMGNHDSASIKTYYEAGFEFISKYPIIFNKHVILSHEPYSIQFLDSFYNIHAHIHNRPFNMGPNSFCVSVERINYTPIAYDEILKETGWFTECSCNSLSPTTAPQTYLSQR